MTPEWIADIVEILDLTDDIDSHSWTIDLDGLYIFTIKVNEEVLTFRAGTDGHNTGVQYDGWICNMLSSSDVLSWIAGEFYSRLQVAKCRIRQLENR